MHHRRLTHTTTPFALLLVLAGQAVAAPGDPVGSEFQVNTYTTDVQRFPAVGPAGAGGFVVVWMSDGSNGSDTSYRSVQGQRYSSTGTPVGGEFQVNTYTTHYQQYPAVGPDGVGGFVIVWESHGSSGSDTFSVQGQRYSSTGTPAGGEFQVNTYSTDNQSQPAVGPDGAGGFVVVWSSFGSNGSDTDYGWNIQGQRYSSTGAPAGGEFQVNTYSTNDQRLPAVGPDGAGGFVVVWNSFDSSGSNAETSSIQGQRYSNTGTAAGSEFQVNTYTTGPQYFAAVGPDGAGGFVVLWESNGSSGSDTSSISVQGQRYNSTGTPVGSQFQVNTYTTNHQRHPTVGPDGAGGFVVVWNSRGSSGSDTSSYSVHGQRYSSAGTPVGSEFQVNTFTANYQYSPAVGPDGAGGFVVVWYSDGSSGTDTSHDSIQGQRFEGGACGNGIVESGETCDDGNTADGDCCSATCQLLGSDADTDMVGNACDNCPTEPNPDQRDADTQDGGDVCDACPTDATDTCDPGQSAGASIDAAGGVVETPDDTVTITIPPGALATPTSISVTETLGDIQIGPFGRALAVELGPEGQTFATPVTVTFQWADANNDGKVDGTSISEATLSVWREGVEITGRCSETSCTAGTCTAACCKPVASGCVTACCNVAANTWTLQLTAFSEYTVEAVAPIPVLSLWGWVSVLMGMTLVTILAVSRRRRVPGAPSA